MYLPHLILPLAQLFLFPFVGKKLEAETLLGPLVLSPQLLHCWGQALAVVVWGSKPPHWALLPLWGGTCTSTSTLPQAWSDPFSQRPMNHCHQVATSHKTFLEGQEEQTNLTQSPEALTHSRPHGKC